MTAAERDHRHHVVATVVTNALSFCLGVLAAVLVQAVLS
ncbi:hypothetical protein PAERUG_E15_London_28_01_14_07921 [Pseudomonas aeruginosa]|nr:hypothetical protein PAERUG_E15_London_28_01_14_07921 [Pseudomonas aeruginosa]